MTAAEEDPEYSSIVSEYLKRTQTRRVPWGGIVVGGHITQTRSFTERRIRAELGETAIALLSAMGVDTKALDEITGLPWNAKPEELIAKLQEIRSRDQVP